MLRFWELSIALLSIETGYSFIFAIEKSEKFDGVI